MLFREWPGGARSYAELLNPSWSQAKLSDIFVIRVATRVISSLGGAGFFYSKILEIFEKNSLFEEELC